MLVHKGAGPIEPLLTKCVFELLDVWSWGDGLVLKPLYVPFWGLHAVSQRWFANDQVATNGRYLELEELIHSEVGTGEEEVIVVRY